ncbi:hypothetical protein V1507DRAFT_461276 [Lipomyces tetrasporus]
MNITDISLKALIPLLTENRQLTPAATEVMTDLVKNSSAPRTTIASFLNTTFDLHLLGRNVSNRTYDYTKASGSWTAKFCACFTRAQTGKIPGSGKK